MKEFKKVIILVMSSNNPTYKELENSIKETWYNLKNNDVEIIFYKEGNELSFQMPNLYLPCGDGFYNLGQKTLLSFEWVLNNFEFDYIYRSNLGTFVDIDNLLNFIKDKPKEKFYCGIKGKDKFYFGKEVEFASGSGYFLSSDLVNLVIDNKNLWNHNVVDDVELGYLLSNLGIGVDDRAIRKNICDNIIDYNIGDKFVDKIDESNLYHIRLRSTNRKLDIENMKNIYKNKIK